MITVKKFLSLVLVILSLIGIMDASYITYEKLSGQIPPCGAGFDCGGVLESPWAYIGPIPLSVFGLFYYVLVFSIASLHFLDVDIQMLITSWTKSVAFSFPAHQLLLYLTTFGFFFSLYLLSLMAFVIQAWCLYCLISAAVCISLFVTSLILNKVSSVPTTI